MGPNQICINVGVARGQQAQRQNPHAPNPEAYPEVGDYPSSLPCGINHVRQELASRKLKPPQDYRPSAYRKDSFFELVKETAYYRGQWSHGQPQGQGEVIFRDRSYFRGFFKDMQARGPQCLFVLADGAYYLGAVAHSKRDGHGIFVDKGYSYEGEWLANMPHGNGREVFPNGDRFEGRFKQGQRVGNGIYLWGNGPYQRFQGVFQGNLPSQKGQLSMRKGQIVEGQFSCVQNFDISHCIIKAKQYKLNNCLVNDGQIQSFAFNGRNFKKNDKENVLTRKKLIHCSETNEETINKIIQAIQRGYNNAKKHSEALQEIRKALPEYRCDFWTEIQARKGILIAEICGRKVQIRQKE